MNIEADRKSLEARGATVPDPGFGFEPGRNCWRIARADRLAFLVDGDAYFRSLQTALESARRSVWIVGWDFNPQVKLRPAEPESEALGAMLRRLVEANENLFVRILVWSMGPLYSSHSLDLYVRHPWADHPRIELRFDVRHPIRAAHHQKIVSIDDGLAYVGGIDLTGGRWDVSAHPATSPLRVGPTGEPSDPVHDVQVLVEGESAIALAKVVKERWRHSGAAFEDGPAARPEGVAFPKGTNVDLADCGVAIARTLPGGLFRRPRREALQLTLDMLAAAERHIYLETQYFASFKVARLLERRLRERDGPEIVVVVTKSSRGIVEQFIMAHNRDRLIRRLKAADIHDRLRVTYAVVPGDDGETEVLIHSKVVVIDDRIVRVGSSNLNNRSEGLDTECDIAVLAEDDRQRAAIAGFRDRLLAEHLDCDPAELAEAIADTGLVAAIERFAGGPRGLRTYSQEAAQPAARPLPGTGILDPRVPFWPLQKFFRRIGRLFTGRK